MTKIMTVGDVKRALEEYPEDMPVVIEDHTSPQEYDVCFDISKVSYSNFSPNVHGRKEAKPCVRITPARGIEIRQTSDAEN